MINLLFSIFCVITFVTTWRISIEYFRIRDKNKSAKSLEYTSVEYANYQCKIPDIVPNAEEAKQFLDIRTDLHCNIIVPDLIQDNLTHFYFSHEPYFNPKLLNCTYKYFNRVKKGTRVKFYFYKKHIMDHTVKATKDFVKVECKNNGKNVYEKYMAFVPHIKKRNIKAEIEQKFKPNMLFIGIAGSSRLNLYRNLPKTVAYLKAISAIEFDIFNVASGNKHANLHAILSGMKIEEVKKLCDYTFLNWDNCKEKYIWKYLQESNYTTAFAEDSSWVGIFETSPFKTVPTDYWYPTYNYVVEQNRGEKDVVSSKTHNHCMGGKLIHREILSYCTKFLETMKKCKQAFHGFFWIRSLNYDDSSKLHNADEDIFEFLKKVYTEGYLKNTFLFFFSNRGHSNTPFAKTYQGAIEERMPFLFIYVPQRFKQQYKQAFRNLFNNRHALITPYDIYDTQRDILNTENISDKRLKMRQKPKYSYKTTSSLFDEIPKIRNCHMAGIEMFWCACAPIIEEKIGSYITEHIAIFLVENILNSLLKSHQQCARLSLENVVNATSLSLHAHETAERHFTEYRIRFKTKPGTGIFDAKVKYLTDFLTFNITEDIVRVNSYSDESECVQDGLLKRYCYCRY